MKGFFFFKKNSTANICGFDQDSAPKVLFCEIFVSLQNHFGHKVHGNNSEWSLNEVS